MKKITFLLLLLMGGIQSFAQSLDDVKKFTLLNQFDKAKEAVDKFLQVEKNQNNAEAWYFKGFIYNGVSRDSALEKKWCSSDCKMESFNAFKKYMELDAKGSFLKDESYGSLFDLYNGYFDRGASAFNAQNYEGAFQNFKNALLVEEYINKNGFDYKGFKFGPIDTSLVLNTAIAARLAKKEDDAATFYTQLVNANVNAPQYLEAYQFLVDYYERKGDVAKMQATIDKGKTLYPTDSFWMDAEMSALTKEKDKDKMFAKYEEMYKKYPSNFVVAYNYAVELYNALYTSDKKPANAEALGNKLNDVLKSAIQQDTTPNANVLMARHLYAAAADCDDAMKAIKGTKPEDAKKKTDLKAKFMKNLNDCIPYAEAAIKYFAAQPKLKASQKTNYKSMLDYLSQIYLAKGDAKKSADYDKKRSEVDKM